jgi:hypothetical protein
MMTMHPDMDRSQVMEDDSLSLALLKCRFEHIFHSVDIRFEDVEVESSGLRFSFTRPGTRQVLSLDGCIYETYRQPLTKLFIGTTGEKK